MGCGSRGASPVRLRPARVASPAEFLLDRGARLDRHRHPISGASCCWRTSFDGRHVEWLRAAATMIVLLLLGATSNIHIVWRTSLATTTTAPTTSDVPLCTFRSEPRNVSDRSITFFLVPIISNTWLIGWSRLIRPLCLNSSEGWTSTVLLREHRCPPCLRSSSTWHGPIPPLSLSTPSGPLQLVRWSTSKGFVQLPCSRMYTLTNSHFWRPHNKTSHFRRPHQYKSIPIPTLKCSQFRIPRQQQNQFNPYIEIRSSSIPFTEIEPISTTHTKTMAISMLALKPSGFWPAYKNQASFDHPRKNAKYK